MRDTSKVQGAWRLRKLGRGHSLRCLVIPEFAAEFRTYPQNDWPLQQLLLHLVKQSAYDIWYQMISLVGAASTMIILQL